MTDLQQEIQGWLHLQPDWLQQAAEALLTSGLPSDKDIQTLVQSLKTSEGQQVTTHRTFAGIVPKASATGGLRLLEIGDISGIENLGPRLPLNFGAGNLCVIYGHNGSGKSGYARLLKKACGKPRAKELKHNVFEPLPHVRKCGISYEVAGVAHKVEWLANGAPIDALRGVDIFDTDSSMAYLTEERAVSYTPPAVALFEALAHVCDQIRARLQSEQDLLRSALPVMPQEFSSTEAGHEYRSLRSELDDAEVQRRTQWQFENEIELEDLIERLKTGDPGELAVSKRSTKRQIDQIANQLSAAAAALGDESLLQLRNLRAVAAEKRRIAIESARVDVAQLDGVGTETWRAMWEAAREYSQIAYAGSGFPVTNDGALCVLCQQTLGPDAQTRLRAFEEFVEGKVEGAARAAEDEYKKALAALRAPPTREELATQCRAAGLMEAAWAERLGHCWDQFGGARQSLLAHEVGGPIEAVKPPSTLLAELQERSAALGRESAQHEEDAAQPNRTELVRQRLNLEARRWVAQQAAAVKAEVARLRQSAKYDDWKRLANSQRISVRAGEIAEQVITRAFVDRFNQELKALGASRIKVELVKSRTEKGRALHRLRLRGASSGPDFPEAILSDGERRIVGLAAFLADAAGQPLLSPFVFDDPISSLDHDFEGYVARRLTELAQNRQVLVLTHRLSLYGALEDAARKIGETWKKQHLVQRCIETFAGVAGHPADQAAWAGSTAGANSILSTRLDEAKKVAQASGAEAYRSLAQGICSDFRKLIERTVEDDLLNQVVKRHRRSVTTDNRLAPLFQIRRADCEFIDGLMSKYSSYEHSQSSEVPIFIPEEPELREDLDSLRKWREDFKSRSKEAGTNA